MSIDIDNISSDFPILQRQLYRRRMVYLDHAATSLTPECVVNALAEGYRCRKANVHRGVHTLSQEATEAMETTRRKVAAYIHAADSAEIVFTRGTTEALNLVAASYGSLLSEGDEVYVEAKVEAAASGLSGLLSGLFGGQQMNAPQAGGSMGRGGPGDFGGFSGDMGSKPERNYSGGGNP